MSTGVAVPEAIRLALAHHQAGRLDDAATLYAQILAVVPEHPDILHLSGALAHQQGDSLRAVELITRALARQPAAPMYVNLGIALRALRRDGEAVQALRSALQAEPQNRLALANLAAILRHTDRHAETAELCLHWQALEPAAVDAAAWLGGARQALGDRDGAIVAYRQALALKPDHAEVWNNLGMALLARGDTADAVAALRQALALAPTPAVHSNLLYALLFSPELTPEAYLEEARRYGAAVGASATPAAQWQRPVDPQRLRVGLVSGDLRFHPVGFFLENVLAQLDRTRVELCAYPTLALEDALTARLRPHFAVWRCIEQLDDDAAAQCIRDDAVQVLIDLSGHTAWNRLPVFARRPAPVQVSWLGYSASTGVPAIDWLLADAVTVPESERGLYSERICYLPDTRICFSAPAASPAVAALPAARTGHITFGNFQGMNRINEPVLALWARVLAAVPTARMRVQNATLASEAGRAEFRRRLQAQGIDEARVDLHGNVPRDEYLAAHAEVDLILDTFPYPGGTTTCEALWMGVPTITLAGRGLLARYGADVMHAAGLADWIAHDATAYVARATTAAGDLPALADLRRRLREQLRQSPLFDAPRFARALETALQTLYSGTLPR